MPEKCTTEVCADLTRLEQQVKDLQKQNNEEHKEFFERLNTVERTNAVQDTRYAAILEKLDILTKKVDALEAKPAKRWESLVGQLISLAAAAVIGVILGRMGL